MKLSENFTLDEATYSETAVRMGINNQPDEQQLQNMITVARNMEKVRDLLGGKGIRVNSWLRLPEVNVAVGGSKVSSHMNGWAVDFTCARFGDPHAVCKVIQESGIQVDQVIHEFGRWTHISFAPEMRGQFMTIFKPQNKYVNGILTAEEYAKQF
jgi:hypothetical protein